MYDPTQREDFIHYLESIHMYTEAAKQLIVLLNDSGSHTATSSRTSHPGGGNKHQLWMKLCDICANHVENVSGELQVGIYIYTTDYY